jgi:hypothetical protein
LDEPRQEIELAAEVEILSMGVGGGGDDHGKVVEESKRKKVGRR